MRGAEQVESSDALGVRELQNAPSRGSHTRVDAVVGWRESGAQIVDGVDGRVGRQRGDGESPREGIAHEAVNKDQRRAGAGFEITHASVGEVEPVLFDCAGRGRRPEPD